MKKFLSILLAIAFFVSSTGFTITTHHCGGRVHEQNISFVAEGINCGMEKALEEPCEDNAISDNCCLDDFQTLKIADSFQSVDFDKQIDAHFFIAFTSTYINLFTVENNTYNKYLDYAPPLPDKDIPVLVQSFLI